MCRQIGYIVSRKFLPVISSVVGVFGTVLKDVEKRLGEPENRANIETIQLTGLLNYLKYSGQSSGLSVT